MNMKQKKILLIIQAVLWGVTALVLIGSALSIYGSGLSLRSANPTADIYTVEAIRQRAVFALPVLAVSMATSVILAVLGVRDESADKAAVNVDFGKNTPERGLTGASLKRFRTIMIAAALICIIIGMLNGSMSDVFIKASKICTECIGLG